MGLFDMFLLWRTDSNEGSIAWEISRVSRKNRLSLSLADVFRESSSMRARSFGPSLRLSDKEGHHACSDVLSHMGMRGYFFGSSFPSGVIAQATPDITTTPVTIFPGFFFIQSTASFFVMNSGTTSAAATSFPPVSMTFHFPDFAAVLAPSAASLIIVQVSLPIGSAENTSADAAAGLFTVPIPLISRSICEIRNLSLSNFSPVIFWEVISLFNISRVAMSPSLLSELSQFVNFGVASGYFKIILAFFSECFACSAAFFAKFLSIDFFVGSIAKGFSTFVDRPSGPIGSFGPTSFPAGLVLFAARSLIV